MPRSFSAGKRSVSLPVSARTSQVLPWSMWPAVPTVSGIRPMLGTAGAAATVETLATQAAIDILRHGGNAVDAAVAAAGVLGVTEPFSCGVGGGGFMVVYRANDGKVTTIDHREMAPAAMRPDSFW